MPKKTIRIAIPTSHPDKLEELVADVWEQHLKLGASSPLAGSVIINMTRYEELKTEALEKRELARKLHAQANALTEQSRNAFGVGMGQSITTPDTLYHELDKIKRILLVAHSGNEEALSEWGFNVVVGSAGVGAKKKKKPL
ncbi:MAG: hypothetical protein V4615_03525 [Bacteroidota bacterium]